MPEPKDQQLVAPTPKTRRVSVQNIKPKRLKKNVET
jgi:hypothetical protein